VGRTGILFLERADERPVLDPGHVRRVREREIRVRPLVVGQPLERPRGDERLRKMLVLLIRAVAPMDVIGLSQRRDLLYPPLKAGVVGAGLVRRCGMGHEVSATPKDSVGDQAYPGQLEY